MRPIWDLLSPSSSWAVWPCPACTRARTFIGSKQERLLARQRTLGLYELWIAVEAGETAQRGYLLTQEAAYLLPFPGARQQEITALATLRTLYAPDAPEQRELNALGVILTNKFDELTETVRLARTGYMPSALEIVKSNYGQHLTLEARDIYQRLKVRSELELENLRSKSDAVLSRGLWTVGYACVLAMAALAAAILVVNADSSKRRRIELELRAANLEAQQATAAKSMFLATMSHELRTPLNAICGMADLLREGQLEPEHRHFADVIARSGTALLSLVNDVLDFSKIEAGKLELESGDFVPEQLIQAQLDIVRGQAIKKGLELRQQLDPALPVLLRGDAGRLGQVVLNLLSNALKFTETGSVTVRLMATALPATGDKAAQMRLEVADTGIGMTDEQMSRLFLPFSQVHQAPQTTYGGTGLGLAICQHLVNLMQGTIGVQANPEGGSIFWIALCLEVPSSAMEARAEASEASALALAADAALAPSDQPRRHILVAEDNAINQLLISKQLERLGYQSHIVGNGAEAIAALIDQSYDLVLMDCQMPEMDGYEASRRIRALEEQTGKRVPILALTANAVRGDAERCIAAGMDGHLTKPVRKEVLGQMLHTWITRTPT